MVEVLVEGASLHVELAGQEDAPPLLMLAGLASDSLSWQPAVPHLEADFRLILPDNRGAGRTQAVLEGLALNQMAGDALAVLDALEIERAAVLGHSMGGLIGWELAHRAPDRISHLLLAASAPLPLPRNLAVLQAIAGARRAGVPPSIWLPLFFPWLFRPAFFAGEGAVEAAIAEALAHPWPQSDAAFIAQVEAIAAHQPTDGAPTVSGTALIGEEDLLFPPALLGPWAEALPHMGVKLIREAGHSLHWDQPEAFARTVREILRHRTA